MDKKPLLAILSIVGGSFINLSIVFADGDGTYNYGSEAAVKDEGVNPASNATFDKRLPPVLPGEELKDGHSKMKVWSTAGSVSSGNVPEAPHAPITGDGSNQTVINGVIVDDRADHRSHH
jgi:hypothetical protein